MSKLTSQAEFAKQIGVTRQYVCKLVREGKITTQNGKVVEAVALKEYQILKYGTDQDPISKIPSAKHLNTDKTAATGKTIQNAKAVKETYVAKLKKREYEILEKEYIHIDKVLNDIETASAVVRSKLLALPSKLATDLEGLIHSEIQTKLEDEINKCFIDLTDLAEEYMELKNNVMEKETSQQTD